MPSKFSQFKAPAAMSQEGPRLRGGACAIALTRSIPLGNHGEHRRCFISWRAA